MIEQSSVHLPELVKDIGQPVSIYLVHLSRRAEIAMTGIPITMNSTRLTSIKAQILVDTF